MARPNLTHAPSSVAARERQEHPGVLAASLAPGSVIDPDDCIKQRVTGWDRQGHPPVSMNASHILHRSTGEKYARLKKRNTCSACFSSHMVSGLRRINGIKVGGG